MTTTRRKPATSGPIRVHAWAWPDTTKPGVPVDPRSLIMTADRLAAFPFKRLISPDGKLPEPRSLRVWAPEPGARFADVPETEKLAALAVLRGGLAVVVASHDQAAFADVLLGLMRHIRLDLAEQDAGRVSGVA